MNIYSRMSPVLWTVVLLHVLLSLDGGMEILGLSLDYGKGQKRRQITFRIGPLCLERLEKVAELFNMTPSQYTKALLYSSLQIFCESTDNRRRMKKKKLKKVETEDAGELRVRANQRSRP